MPFNWLDIAVIIGYLCLMVVAFLSAFVSTVSTHLNWGASYVANEFYKPFIRPIDRFEDEQTAQRHYVKVTRWVVVRRLNRAAVDTP